MKPCVCCGVNLRKNEGTRTVVGRLCIVCHEKACRVYVVVRNEFFTLRK